MASCVCFKLIQIKGVKRSAESEIIDERMLV